MDLERQTESAASCIRELSELYRIDRLLRDQGGKAIKSSRRPGCLERLQAPRDGQGYDCGFAKKYNITFINTYQHYAWGGRATDMLITKKDDEFLRQLSNEEKGSVLLADQGFRDLKAHLPLETGVVVVLPATVKKGEQLRKRKVEESRMKSNVRIVVERCIGELRRFKILKHEFLMSSLYSLEDILVICAGIVNVHPPLK